MSGLHIEEWQEGIAFDVLVTPRASRERIGPVVGDRVKIAVKAPPVEGEANAAVISLLARLLGVRRQEVEIVAGSRGRRKRVRIRGVAPSRLLALVSDAREATDRGATGHHEA